MRDTGLNQGDTYTRCHSDQMLTNTGSYGHIIDEMKKDYTSWHLYSGIKRSARPLQRFGQSINNTEDAPADPVSGEGQCGYLRQGKWILRSKGFQS
ncbi:MAG: hypothetical protein H6R42_637 [Nitrospirae bacterium]|jgi:hypothetical protein|nr:hypothetical protein [Nitrospirota bacterium]